MASASGRHLGAAAEPDRLFEHFAVVVSRIENS
jgi:hypothetical protein